MTENRKEVTECCAEGIRKRETWPYFRNQIVKSYKKRKTGYLQRNEDQISLCHFTSHSKRTKIIVQCFKKNLISYPAKRHVSSTAKLK